MHIIIIINRTSTVEGVGLWPSVMQQDVFTCASRGYISIQQYLQYVGSTTPLHTFISPYPWRAYWCLQSYTNPVAVCATLPGQRLPMCTLQCPLGLVATTLYGSTSTYCCLQSGGGTLGCTLTIDSRQCVLGQHDAALFLANPELFPDHTCTTNLLNAYSIYPMSQEPAAIPALDDALAQSRQLCSNYIPLCHGFVVIQDNSGYLSVYYSDRPFQLSTTNLGVYDQTRDHSLDTESVYHLHRSPNSLIASNAVLLEVPDVQSTIHSVTSYFVERTYGYSCSDERLNVQDYLSNPENYERVFNRLSYKWTLDGMPVNVLTSLMQYSLNNQGANYIFNNDLVDTLSLSDIFNVDLLQQIAYDLQIYYPTSSGAYSNISEEILGTIFETTTGGHANLSTTNNAYPSKFFSMPNLGVVAGQIPGISLIPQTFLPENNVLTPLVPITCIPLTSTPPNTDLRYQLLYIRKQNEFVRYYIPRIGQADNTYNGAIYVYDTVNPSFIEINNGGADPNIANTLVGYFQILDDSTSIIHFDDLGSLLYYMIWRDWIIYGKKKINKYSYIL